MIHDAGTVFEYKIIVIFPTYNVNNQLINNILAYIYLSCKHTMYTITARDCLLSTKGKTYKATFGSGELFD